MQAYEGLPHRLFEVFPGALQRGYGYGRKYSCRRQPAQPKTRGDKLPGDRRKHCCWRKFTCQELQGSMFGSPSYLSRSVLSKVPTWVLPGRLTLAGYRYKDATSVVAGTRAKNRERGLTEVEGHEELMAAQGPSHRHARDGLKFHQDVCPPRSSPDAPLILLALSIRIETAAVPRPGSIASAMDNASPLAICTPPRVSHPPINPASSCTWLA